MEQANSMIELPNMNYVIAGVSDRGRNEDGILMRLRHDGQINWVTYFDRSLNDKFLNVNVTTDNSFITTGGTVENDISNFLVAKFGSSGELSWIRYCTRQDYIDEGADILESADGHYIAVGNTRIIADINVDICVVDIGGPVSVEQRDDLESRVGIGAFPNPFNQSVRLTFWVDHKSIINLTIFNILGQQVYTSAKGLLQQGEHSFIWNGDSSEGKPATSGIYYCQITADSSNMMTSIILLR
jgi:hypothetical protein